MSEDRRKKIEKILEKKWAAYTFALCSAVVLYLALSHFNIILRGLGKAFGFIAPVVYGIIIAYVLNPLVNYIERTIFKKVKRENRRHNAAVATGFITVFALIGILIWFLIPSLIKNIASIIEEMSNSMAAVEEFSNKYADFFLRFNIDLMQLAQSWTEMISTVISSVTENTEMLIDASQSIGKSAANVVLGIILAVYFLLAKTSLLKGINRLRFLVLKEKTYEDHNVFFERCNLILGQFIGFDIIDAIIVGCINAVLMLIFKMPSVLLISVVVGITNLLPTFGPIAGALVGAFVLVLSNPIQAFIFLIFTAIIQTFDGYILKPKMFGDTLGVPAVWILISIIVGGKIFGIVGILLAIPFAAIVAFVYEENIVPKLEKKKAQEEKNTQKE